MLEVWVDNQFTEEVNLEDVNDSLKDAKSQRIKVTLQCTSESFFLI